MIGNPVNRTDDGRHLVPDGVQGHGFKLSPSIGLAMAELITQGAVSSVDLNPLRFNRFEQGDLLTSSYRYNVLA